MPTLQAPFALAACPLQLLSVVEKRPSTNRTDCGYVRFQLQATVDGEPTLAMHWFVIMLTRNSALRPSEDKRSGL